MTFHRCSLPPPPTPLPPPPPPPPPPPRRRVARAIPTQTHDALMQHPGILIATTSIPLSLARGLPLPAGTAGDAVLWPRAIASRLASTCSSMQSGSSSSSPAEMSTGRRQTRRPTRYRPGRHQGKPSTSSSSAVPASLASDTTASIFLKSMRTVRTRSERGGSCALQFDGFRCRRPEERGDRPADGNDDRAPADERVGDACQATDAEFTSRGAASAPLCTFALYRGISPA